MGAAAPSAASKSNGASKGLDMSVPPSHCGQGSIKTHHCDRMSRLVAVVDQRRPTVFNTSPPRASPASEPLVPDTFHSLLLGGVVELGHLNAVPQFLVLCAGVFVFYVAHGYFQEAIFSMPGFHADFGFFVSLCDFVLFALLAGAQLLLTEGRIPRSAPLKNFAGISVALALSIGMGFASLAYLNYPTKVLFKSGKIIPTMLLGALFFRRRYSWLEYLAAVMLCAGLASFTLGQASVSPAFHLTGVAMITVSALAEAAVGNLQEHVMGHHKSKMLEVVFWSNLFSASVVLAYLLASGELWSGVSFVAAHDGFWRTMASEAVVGYLGVFFYLGLVTRFGVAICLGVSALRKVMTICLSFVAFPKPFTWMYVYGAGLVLASILITAALKKRGGGAQPVMSSKVHVV